MVGCLMNITMEHGWPMVAVTVFIDLLKLMLACMTLVW